MLIKLVLTKFKKHEDLTVNFTGGLNVIRGANEAGKSTLYHAISYALYGSRGLPDPLDETVTYGFPASQLKVELVFSHAGIEYTIVRSKSGAVISGGGVKAEGQEGVTSFITSLFGVKQDTALKIMIANQSSLKAAVEGGTQAINLIETLSGMEVIDNLIAKVQAKLPCGNTSGLEKQVAELSERKKPVADFSEFEDAVNTASHNLGKRSAVVNQITSEIEELPIQEARQTLLRIATVRGEAESVRQQKIAAEAILASPAPYPVQDRSEEYAAALNEVRLEADRRKAYARFVAVQQQSESLGTRAEVALNIQMYKTEQQKLVRLISSFDVQIAGIKARKITDKSCALCGKFLEDVPEVVSSNAELDTKIAVILETQAHQQKLLDENNTKLAVLEAAMGLDRKFYIEFSAIEDFVVIHDTVPVQARWKGDLPEPTSGNEPDYRAMALLNKKEYADYVAAVDKRQQATNAIIACADRLAFLLVEDDTEANAQVARWEDLQRQLAEANKLYQQDHAVYLDTEARLSTEKQLFANAMAQYNTIQDQLKSTKTLLQEYRDNNDLIQRLRQARPLVAQQLWTLVLGQVSHYLSRIRGVPSVVAKSDKGFTVDGKSYTNVSGSTIDSLGLSVRISLQKTFLPNIDFMLLDEPASGCDDNREAAMLGVLSGVGYNQMVVVTHSPIADTFAAQVLAI